MGTDVEVLHVDRQPRRRADAIERRFGDFGVGVVESPRRPARAERAAEFERRRDAGVGLDTGIDEVRALVCQDVEAVTREQAQWPDMIRQVQPAFERAVPLGAERVMVEVHPRAGPTVSLPHVCSRVSSSSTICGRASSVVWASAKLLHTENWVPLPENHITGCTTGRSLMMKPRSAWPERNAISMPYAIRCGMSCAKARAAVAHARSASDVTPPQQRRCVLIT